MNYLHSVRSCQFWKQLDHESKGPRHDDLVTSKSTWRSDRILAVPVLYGI